MALGQGQKGQGNTGVKGSTGVTGVQGVQGSQGITGTDGIQGITGSQGVQGVQGSTGVKGSTGVTGVQGVQGSQGITGTDGIQGITGSQGVQGVQGNTGVKGSTGVTGVQGAQGPQGEDGVTGVKGVTGSQGVQGSVGPQGATGIQGITGVQGPQGAQGAQGLTGIKGVTGVGGPQGPDGTTGAQGSQGVQGATGVQGVQGIQGNTGVQGVQGTTGRTGVQGAQGITGADGIQGATGVQGVQGIQGNTGVQGVQGTTGRTGVQGAQGITGADGAQGNQGVTGAQGVQGVQGIQGITGVRGNTGVQGVQGITGADGAQGNQGVTGAQGVQGVQGIQGLTGVRGNTGVQGVQGITGADGIQGATGVQGVQGIQGNTGVQGVQGTTGRTGVQGAAGVTGAQGVQGPQGLTGAQGEQGQIGYGAAKLGSSCFAYYPLNEGTGTTGADRSGNGGVATISGAGAAWITNSLFGWMVDFDDTNPDPGKIALSSVNVGNAWSFEMFVTLDAMPATYVMVLSRAGSTPYLSVNTAKFRVSWNDSGSVQRTLIGSSTLATGTLYHLCATHAGNTTRVYVNGVQDGEDTTYDSIDTPAGIYNVGWWNGSLYGMNGRAGEVRIYNRELSAAEVAAHSRQLYLDGAQGSVGPQGPTGLLGNSLANQVQVVTGGWIKTGSGTKDSTLTGFQWDNLEFVAQVTGVDQFVVGIDGRAKAGAGAVTLDKDGVSVQGTSNATDGWVTQALAKAVALKSVSSANQSYAGSISTTDYDWGTDSIAQLHIIAGNRMGVDNLAQAHHETVRAFLSAVALGAGVEAGIDIGASSNTARGYGAYNEGHKLYAYINANGIFLGSVMSVEKHSTEGTAKDGKSGAYLNGHLTLREVSGTPTNPASGTEGRIYLKGDKLIAQFNDAGTVRYKYLDLTDTGVTWVHTTTAP